MKSKPVEYGWVIEEVEKHDTGAHEESANDGSLDCCSRIPVSSRFSFPSRHLHNRPCHPTGNCRCKKIVYRLLLSTPDRKATRRCNRTTSDELCRAISVPLLVHRLYRRLGLFKKSPLLLAKLLRRVIVLRNGVSRSRNRTKIAMCILARISLCCFEIRSSRISWKFLIYKESNNEKIGRNSGKDQVFLSRFRKHSRLWTVNKILTFLPPFMLK